MRFLFFMGIYTISGVKLEVQESQKFNEKMVDDHFYPLKL